MAWGTPTAIGTVGTSTGNTSVTPGLPTHSAGDSLFLVGGCRFNTTLGVLGGPAGYTEIYRLRTTGQSEIALWIKKSAGVSESAPTITISGATTGANIAFMFSATGGDVDNLATILNVAANTFDSSADTALDVPAITPNVANCLVLAVGFHNNNNSVSAGPTGYTNHASGLNASGGSATLATAYSIQTTAATIAASSFTMGGSSVQASFVVSLKSAGTGAGTGTWNVGSIGTAVGAASGTDLTVGLPSYSVGDNLFVELASRQNSDTWTALTAGWTVVTGSEFNGMATFTKVAASTSETTPQFRRSASSSQSMIGQSWAATGGSQSPSTIVATSGTAGDASISNTITTAAISAPSEDNCLVVWKGKWHDNTSGSSFTKPAAATAKLFEGAQAAGGGLTQVLAYLKQTTAASVSADSFTGASTSALDYSITMTLKAQPSSSLGKPEISAVSTITVGSTFTITGVNFSASGNTVTLAGVSITPTLESTTSITCPAVSLGSMKYGPNDLIVTNTGGQTDVIEVVVNPAATAKFVDIAGTLAPTGNRPVPTPDFDPGIDQVEYSNPVNGTLANCYMDPTGWAGMKATNVALDCTFDYRINDGTGWGTAATVTFKASSYGDPAVNRSRGRNTRRGIRIMRS
jgi:hypothetical protein